MVMWYWSADTLFWQLSIDHDMEVQYQRFNSNQGGNCPVTPLPLPQSLYGRTDGRTDARTVTWLPNFLGLMVYQNFLPMVLRWRASRAGAPLLVGTKSCTCNVHTEGTCSSRAIGRGCKWYVHTPSHATKVCLIWEGGLKWLSECRKSGLQQLDFSKFPREIYPWIPLDAHGSSACTHPSKILPTALSMDLKQRQTLHPTESAYHHLTSWWHWEPAKQR